MEPVWLTANLAGQLRNIKNGNAQDVAAADDVVVGQASGRIGHGADPVIHLLWSFKDLLPSFRKGLSAAGGRQEQNEQQGVRDKTPRRHTQFVWLHLSR